MSRRRTLDLTEQQERVLELLARGRTNFEVAQALDMTLDGAKYHIRQVFDKLGVDSREEAVAAWKASRGGVFERIRGWLWPVGAVAAGGVAVVAAVVVGAVALSGGFGTTSSAAGGGSSVPAGVWVAEVKTLDPTGRAGPGPLEIFKAGDRSEAAEVPGPFQGVQPFDLGWSFDGGYIAALDAKATGLSFAVEVVHRDGSGWSPVTIAHVSGGAQLSWAPHADVLSIVDGGLPQGLAQLVDPNGKPLASIALPPQAQAAGAGISSVTWAPEATELALTANDRLVILGLSGGNMYTPPGGPQPMSLLKWLSPDTLSVTTTPGSGFVVHLSGNNTTWQPGSGSDTADVLPTADTSIVAAWNSPPNVPLVSVGATADGSGMIFGPGFSPLADRTKPLDYRLVIQGNGKVTAADLGSRILDPTILGEWYDIVITK